MRSFHKNIALTITSFALQAMGARAEAEDARRRVDAERGAMEIRAAMLAPELRALEEGRVALEGYQREGLTMLAQTLRCNQSPPTHTLLVCVFFELIAASGQKPAQTPHCCAGF